MPTPTTPGPRSSHRRRKQGGGAGRLGLAGAVTGVVGIAAVAGAIVWLRPGDDAGPATSPPPSLAGQGSGPGGLPAARRPRTGPAQTFNTPEGYGYALGAARAGVTATPPKTAEKAARGARYAYAEYVLTNTQRRPVLLDYPADLFLPRSQVDARYRSRCMPQPGIPTSMCTLPNHSAVTARLGDAPAPHAEDGDTMIPAGASYVVRIATDLPVRPGLRPDEIRLYVWNARYTSDRKGVPLDFP
ncbi:hypothetical protein [Actinomadura rayongensis]|uniref:DUF4232 domain-containing protein n=1 Tax=Actinomadura rayongensis TaxID=1429076 RepID=A0A6I4WAE4_9ACTN|nr:hypothetical protein [Actinomadura rayongensis]MXQ63672.1 hypothetical protein [Actinomadura rayongensis]